MAACHPRRRALMSPSVDAAEAGPSLKSSTSLRKGATFHASKVASDPNFTPPTLPRAQSNLDEATVANRRRIALTLEDIDDVLAKTKDLSLSDAPYSLARDSSLPVPRGFLTPPVVDPAMAKEDAERRVLRPRSVRHTRRHESDSGLGSSVASSSDKLAEKSANKSRLTASAITRSAAASTRSGLPILAPKAINRIHEHTLRPLLAEPMLKDFHSIVVDIPRRIRSKEIICLRDLEKTLIFMAPEKTKSAVLYLQFCLTSIRCVQATVDYLSDHEQVRPSDRPYTNGYFLDLKDQICQYGRQLAASKEGGLEDLDLDQADEIKLYGGISENGRPAELIRVKKDGTAISMATGKPVDIEDSPVRIKRSLSQQREDEEEIMRSMARRKKNASPEELAPKRCNEPGCHKEFKRPCDLTKHVKTHSRPWKCPHVTCKYNDFGWPTEKEMDRHVNDKHSDAPAMYQCLFVPCPYKSKRESNCKQHMEKAHGWSYVRTKNNGKKTPEKPASSVQQTPPLINASTPSDTSWTANTPPENPNPMMATDFPIYGQDWTANFNPPPDGAIDMDLVDNPSPLSARSYEQYPPYQNSSTFIVNDEDIYAANVRVQMHMPAPEQLKMMPHQYHAQPAPVAAAPPLHFSPSGQNTMLYTPESLAEGEPFGSGVDFPLYPQQLDKSGYQPLFGEVPSANLGFSQTSQDPLSGIDWSGFPSFHSQSE